MKAKIRSAATALVAIAALLGAAARAQDTPGPQATAGRIVEEITLETPNVPQTPIERGATFRLKLPQFMPGQVMRLPEGHTDTGKLSNVLLPDWFHLKGEGKDRSRITNGFVGDITPGCAFECGNGTTIFENLTIDNPVTNYGDQGETVGYGRTVNPIGGATLIIWKCNVLGADFAIYSWAATYNYIFVFDSNVSFCRKGILAGSTGDKTLPNMVFVNNVNLNGGPAYGKPGEDLVAIEVRGGVLRATNVQVKLVGHPDYRSIKGFWVDPLDPQVAANALLQVARTASTIVAGGCKDICDSDQSKGRILIDDKSCVGSGPGGSWIKR